MARSLDPDLVTLLWPAGLPHLLGVPLGAPAIPSTPSWSECSESWSTKGGWARATLLGTVHRVEAQCSFTFDKLDNLQVSLVCREPKQRDVVMKQLADLLATQLGAPAADGRRRSWKLAGAFPGGLTLSPDFERRDSLYFTVALDAGVTLSRDSIDFVDLDRLSARLTTRQFSAAAARAALVDVLSRESFEAAPEPAQAALHAVIAAAREEAADEKALAVSLLELVRFDDLVVSTGSPDFRSAHAELLFKALFCGYYEQSIWRPGWRWLDAPMLQTFLDRLADSPEDRTRCLVELVRALHWDEPNAKTVIAERVRRKLTTLPLERWSLRWSPLSPSAKVWMFELLTQGCSDEDRLLLPTRAPANAPDVSGLADAAARWFALNRGAAAVTSDVPWAPYLRLVATQLPARFSASFAVAWPRVPAGYEQRRLCDALATEGKSDKGSSWLIVDQRITCSPKNVWKVTAAVAETSKKPRRAGTTKKKS